MNWLIYILYCVGILVMFWVGAYLAQLIFK